MMERRLPVVLLVVLSVPRLIVAQDKGGKDNASARDRTTPPSVIFGKSPRQQNSLDLRWRFEVGKTFYQKLFTRSEHVLNMPERMVKQTQELTFTLSWTPLEHKGDTWKVRRKIEGIVLNLDTNDTRISYDSARDVEADHPLGELCKALVGSELVLTLDARTLKMTRLEGRQQLLTRLVAANPRVKHALAKMFDKDALLALTDPNFTTLPNKTVPTGQKWLRKGSLELGPWGRYANQYTYTLQERAARKNLHEIHVEAQLVFQKPAWGELPYKVKQADFKNARAKGKVYFNAAKGRVEKSTMTVKVQGAVDIEMDGQTTRLDLSQTHETHEETMDENPLP